MSARRMPRAPAFRLASNPPGDFGCLEDVMIFEWGNEAMRRRGALRADAAKPQGRSLVASCLPPSFSSLATPSAAPQKTI